MLGFHKMTQQGTAEVVSCQMRRGGVTHTDSHGRSTDSFDVIVDVTPDSGAAPFRAETRQRFSSLRFPNPGDTLKVRCNPEKQAVEIDLSDDERFNPKIFRRANEEKLKREHDETLNAPPGTPASASASASDDPELAELVRLDEEERRSGGS
jgi:hypothetical protein